MPQAYSDSTRESDPHALPDIEIFELAGWLDQFGDKYENGWYWWTCFPGCLPDNDPCGPFDTETEALASAQEGAL